MTLGWQDGGSFGDDQLETVGRITVSETVWNILFLKAPEARRKNFLDKAVEHAKSDYGDDAIIANPKFESEWSPLSLLLGLDLLGFVERGSVTVDVLKPIPPPPPPSPPPKAPPPPAEPEPIIVISFPVDPERRYEDKNGYVGIEYLTNEQVKELTKTRLEKRRAKAETFEKEYAKIPPGGHVVINIGRQDLLNANTKWYAAEIFEAGEEILIYRGEEGVPNVRGRDGNWWNTIALPLETPIEDYIEVRILDLRLELSYEFTVSRLETILPRVEPREDPPVDNN